MSIVTLFGPGGCIVPIRQFWIFLTEQCNLSCDYCFFSQRGEKRSLSWQQIEQIMQFFPKQQRFSVILSGGEPLVCWSLTEQVIRTIRQQFPLADITVQTNMTCMDEEKVSFLKKQNIVVEPGIDGLFSTNQRHRKGIDHTLYQRSLYFLSRLIEQNVPLNPTMTVHPDEVEGMVPNFFALVQRGVRAIDVHPAFMTPWDTVASSRFIQGYKTICLYEQQQKHYLICKSYSVRDYQAIDMVVQPDGWVLGNWTYLMFPVAQREPFYYLCIRDHAAVFQEDVLNDYLNRIQQWYQQPRTYREFSNLNAWMLLQGQREKKSIEYFLAYKKLCIQIQRLDQMFLSKEDAAV